MARWEPDAKTRLVAAAVELFGEFGYHATTTAQIAQRAGLTKTTFFRHFPDKREVLFAGQTVVIEQARSGVTGVPRGAGPMVMVAAALASMTSVFGNEQRSYGVQLGRVIAAHAELRERFAFKQATITAAVATELRDRGVEGLSAELAAELGVRAFYLGYQRWVDPGNTRPLTELSLESLAELRTSIAALE